MSSKKWTFEKLKAEALKYKTRKEFRAKNPSAFQIAFREGFLDEICSHMQYICRKWTNKEIIEEGLKHNTLASFRKASSSAYSIAHTRGLIKEIRKNMVILHRSWTNKQLRLEAKKYKNKKEFRLVNPSAYIVAHKRGILDKICAHMERLIHEDYTNKELQNIAFMYTNKEDFRNNNNGAYQVASKRGVLNKICRHMKKDRSVSLMELELSNIIGSIFPSIKKLRDGKVKIENKPYIYGFEIDIFIPELNLGIEFDGIYYHSFKRMRKSYSKRFWSDEDIRNYHEIKDAWFATKGITILHIKEEDWIENKQACIDKCFVFLNTSMNKVA